MQEAAVVRRSRALSGFLGFKGCLGGRLSEWFNVGDKPRIAIKTGGLEYRRGRRNKSSSGEMLRYDLELRERRQLTRLRLTLKHESVGSEQD